MIKKGNLHHAGHPGEEGRTRSITHPKNFPQFCKKKPAVEIRFSSGNTQCGGGVVVGGGGVGGGGRYQFSARTILAFLTQQGEKWSGLNLWSVLKTKFKPQ